MEGANDRVGKNHSILEYYACKSSCVSYDLAEENFFKAIK